MVNLNLDNVFKWTLFFFWRLPLKKGNNFHSKLGKVEVSNLTNFDSLIFTLSVGGEGGNVNDTIFTLFAAYLF